MREIFNVVAVSNRHYTCISPPPLSTPPTNLPVLLVMLDDDQLVHVVAQSTVVQDGCRLKIIIRSWLSHSSLNDRPDGCPAIIAIAR